jgi:hypothetical protein
MTTEEQRLDAERARVATIIAALLPSHYPQALAEWRTKGEVEALAAKDPDAPYPDFQSSIEFARMAEDVVDSATRIEVLISNFVA